MNIIQKQTDDFFYLSTGRRKNNYKEFIDEVCSALQDYKKIVHKIEFAERIIQKIKLAYDEHLPKCTNLEGCEKNKYYENSLFFLQEELEELESELSPEEFTQKEKISFNQTLQKIIDELNLLKLSQQLTYDDFKDEFEELKDMYYLNKKNWVQLFTGKLSEMIAGGVISETISKSLVDIIKINYPDLIRQ